MNCLFSIGSNINSNKHIYVAVKSTGNYCLTSFPIKCPKEILYFFKDIRAARKSKFKPCFKCLSEFSYHNASTYNIDLDYYPPYDYKAVLQFLQWHILKGIEHIENNIYYRTISLGKYQGWLRVEHKPDQDAIKLEFSADLLPVIDLLLKKIRKLFDLALKPEIIFEHFKQDPILGKIVENNPGRRLPGAFNNFESMVRTVLGQQISLKAATTLSARFIQHFGTKIQTPFAFLTYLAPLPKDVARLEVFDITKLGILAKRAKTILVLAQDYKKIDFANKSPVTIIEQLITLPGIGPWSANYIVMRTMKYDDAFLSSDMVLLRNLGGITARQAETMSQNWRPYRAYALIYIWMKLKVIM